MPIIIALYILTGCSVLVIEYNKLVRYKHITFGTFCFVFFSVLCCIVPGLTLWCGDISRCKNHTEWYAFISYVLTLLALISSYIGYNIGSSGNCFKKNNLINQENKFILLFSIILLTISIIALILYSSGYGGILQTMLKGGQIRASFIQSDNSYTFFKHLIPLSIISSLLLYTDVFIKKHKDYLYIKYLLLIISFVISIIYITANDGRGLAGVYILLFIIINIKYKFEKEKVSLRKITSISIIVCAVIFIMIIESESIFNIFRERDAISHDNSALDILLSEFNFIYLGLYNSIKYIVYGDANFMLYNDLVNGAFAWLPTSMKPIILEDVWDFNTKLINDGGYGQSPVNIVAQSFYDLGLFGVFIIPFIYTFFIGKLETIFFNDHTTIGLVFFTVLAFYLGKAMVYFSLYNLMMNLFFIFFSWFLYQYIVIKVRRIRLM